MKSEQFLTYINTSKSLNGETLDEAKKLTVDFPWFSGGWLLYLKNLKKLGHADYDDVLKKVAVMVPDRKVLFKFLNDELPKKQVETSIENAPATYRLEGDVELQAENSLIDKFLSINSERLRTVKHNQDTNGNGGEKWIVDQSVKEDEELVTETLASIYFQQKNFDKALDAYKKLSLKYPEKSVYFAGRIEEIELLKNNN
ncbi:tetratricopeptide repeat protein [Draconibacterium orientale]|jgi:tetratricopeptide (TPR) repeat protein|uniref:tetratricopeptide repeat protein n=1 Tax=Draconibacterium orientale TaxID=1168034 RepID=UPI002A0A72C1|nr:tetratricopeptide repeat protein [Draconibacterium orientale]